MGTRVTPCTCGRYHFPHRRSSQCDEFTEAQDDSSERTLAEINAEMLALHDAAEARAINSGAW